MGTNTEHDQPFGSLNTVVVVLRVTEGLDVDLVGIGDLVGSSVTDEDGLSKRVNKAGREDDNHRQSRTLQIDSWYPSRSTSPLTLAT